MKRIFILLIMFSSLSFAAKLIGSDKTKLEEILDRLIIHKDMKVSNLASMVKYPNGYLKQGLYSKNGTVLLYKLNIINMDNNDIKGIFIIKKLNGQSYPNYILLFDFNKKIKSDRVPWRGNEKNLPKLDKTKPLNKPSLIDPVSNKEVDKYNVDFKWRKVEDATEYRFLLSTKKDFSNFSDSYNGGSNKCIGSGCYTYPNDNENGPLYSNTFRIDTLAKSGQTYYWKVRAYNHNTKAASPWSATGVFKTKGGSSSNLAIQAYNNAKNNLNKKSGYTYWNGTKKYGIWADKKYTYCARLVRMSFGKAGKYSSAISMYYNYRNLVKTYGTPPKGAVVFYAKHKENGSYGHVGIADGSGHLYSATSRYKGVTYLSTYAFKAKYLGYVTADVFFDNY